jgi:DNA adenine methylase
MANIRYPGSKSRLKRAIIDHFPESLRPRQELFQSVSQTYVEPFFGSGAVGWEMLSGLRDGITVVINDLDYWIACLWLSVRDAPEELIARIRAAQLSPSIFADYKKQDGDKSIYVVDAGFRKLLLHQMSFSGLGFKAGGPIGGADASNSRYDIGCRWNPVEQERLVRMRSELMRRFRVSISYCDFEIVIKEYDNPNAFFYLDPPYVEKGNELYRHSFSVSDHERLAALAKNMKGRFVLSYDDCDIVRRLYAGHQFRLIEAEAVYSICGSRKNHELIIKNF